MNAVRALLAILLSVGCNTVYGFQGFHRDVLNLPNVTDFQVTSQAVPTSSLAWTSDDVIQSPLTSLTMCVWAKSTNLKQTGTIVAYTIDNRVEFALLAFKSPSASDTSNYDVYLVVSGRRMSRSVQLRMDDVRWHHVCVTWEAEGIFRAFMDQTLIEEMNDLPVAEILPGGRFYFGTTLKTNNTSQENVVPFVGKLTGFSLWNTSLDFAAIRALGDCNAFNEKQLLGRDIQNTTAVLTTGSRANLIY
uniref:Pentraxin (PTX) domain-containing protein n=3 Tax=Ciona intestinalis TaxID=7719 RepID=F6YUM8_CIOIN